MKKITVNLNENKSKEKELLDYLESKFSKSNAIKEALYEAMLKERGIITTTINVEPRKPTGIDEFEIEDDGMIGFD